MSKIQYHRVPIMEGDFYGDLLPSEFSENWPQYVLELDNVIVAQNGVILNDNFEYIKEANFGYAYWNFLSDNDLRPDSMKEYLESPYDFFPSVDTEKRIHESLPSSNYVFALHFFNWYPFGHHFDVMLPLQKIEHLKLTNSRLLVNASNWESIVELDKHFELFGYPPAQLLKLDTRENKYTFIPKLFYPSPACYPAQISKSALEYARSKYSALGAAEDGPSRLYLSRESCPVRRVINEKEVQKFLRNEGFTITSGTKSIKKDIELFRNARQIIGPHGSRWHNIIFSKNLQESWEFCPHNRRVGNFIGFSKTIGSDHSWIESPADEDHNISISVNYLKSILHTS